MPEARDLFPEIETWDRPRLELRYQELKAQCSGDPQKMDDDEKLREMVVILNNLRKKSAGPPKAKAPAAARAGTPALEDLL